MPSPTKDRHARAATELQEQANVPAANPVVDHLSANFNALRDLLLKRLHEDMESRFGVDSAIAPMTQSEEERELRRARVEIEIFVVVTAANEMVEGKYVEQDEAWCRDWLLRLRLGGKVAGGIESRFLSYLKRDLAHRRLLFSDLLARCLPEVHRAPLVVFRLFPKAVRLAVALSFNDLSGASKYRDEQIAFLPAIADCVQCRGLPLESGEVCRDCGSPIWNLTWLTAAD